ncbi:MAG: hypothetical protein KAT16_03335 [Candidatus Heimdallarchaeota archaeon]|nr:hypothetical protein [Candidatus Heimdallarchaeota archaeon]
MKDDLKDKVAKLERIVSVLSKENCVFILASLVINGPMNYDELKRETGLGKATIFRNLDLLLKMGFIKKDKDETIEDKRKKRVYFRSEEDFKVPPINRELMAFLEREEKLDIIESVTKYQNSLSDALIRVMTIRRGKQGSQNNRKNISMMVILESSNAQIIEKKVICFLEDIQNDIRDVKRDYTKTMKEPALLRINYIQ